MEVGTFQSVNKVSPEAGSVITGFQSPFSFVQGGEFGFFDLMLQQLLITSPETGDLLQQDGQPLPFPAFDSSQFVFPALESGPENELLINIEDLQGYLEQFNFQGLPEVSVPAIFQELQATLADAKALNQGQVNLTSIFEQATPQQGIELLNFIERSAPTGLNPVQTNLRTILETHVQNLEQVSEENPTLQKGTLGEALRSFIAASETPTNEEGVPTGEQQTPENILRQLFTQVKNPLRDVIGGNPDRIPVGEDGKSVQANPLFQNGPFTNIIPDYLNPELYKQPELTNQTQQLFQQAIGGKEVSDTGSRQVPSETTHRTNHALLDALGLGDPTGRQDGETGLRNSLNLTDQGNQQTQEDSSKPTETSSLKTEEVSHRFEENLKRINEAQAVIKQISKNVSLQEGVRQSEISVKLEPEYLGNLTVRVSMQEGVAGIQILAENGTVRDLLDSNLASLKNSLETSDVKVRDIQVDLHPDAEDFVSDAQLENGAAGKEASSQTEKPEIPFSIDGELQEDSEEDDASSSSSLRDRLHRVNYLA